MWQRVCPLFFSLWNRSHLSCPPSEAGQRLPLQRIKAAALQFQLECTQDVLPSHLLDCIVLAERTTEAWQALVALSHDLFLSEQASGEQRWLRPSRICSDLPTRAEVNWLRQHIDTLTRRTVAQRRKLEFWI